VSQASAIHVVKDTEEGRAFLQDRLALCSTVLAVASGAFWAILVIVQVSSRPGIAPPIWSLGSASHLAQVGVLVGARIFLIRGRSIVTLKAIDATTVIVSVLAFAAMIVFGHEESNARRDLPQQINVMPAVTASALIFLGRAILIPSTAQRTAVLGIVMTVIVVVASAIVFARHSHPLVARSWPYGALYSALWSVTTGVLGVVASAVLYRLQARARVADELGQYRLEEQIGEGGMGIVYRASHAMLRRPTAVKLLPPDRAGEHAIARFEKEVQLTSRLAHPNTIAIYDYGRTPDGVFYYAMEYIDGVDLEHLVDRAGPMPPNRVVHVLAQTCDALDEAHSIGLIHRDVKPANILLFERARAADVVKVVDFGLVKEIENPNAELSGANTIVGTPLYLAPEAIVSPGTVDARSDLYAVGCLAYYLLTGRPPFTGTTALEVFSNHLQTTPERPSTHVAVPSELEKLIMRCLDKDADARPQSAAAMADALRAMSIPRWSDEDARQWWREHGEGLRAARKAVGPSGRTLAVDLSRRF